MAGKAAVAFQDGPTTTGALIAFVDTRPGELRDGNVIASAVADVEPSAHGNEAHFAFLAVERNEARLDQIDGIPVPEVHGLDPPPAFEGRCQAGGLLRR